MLNVCFHLYCHGNIRTSTFVLQGDQGLAEHSNKKKISIASPIIRGMKADRFVESDDLLDGERRFENTFCQMR